MKTRLFKFLTWLRNGFCFCTTWLLILMIIFNYFYGTEAISLKKLVGMLLFSAGGVLIFCLCFTELALRKMSFSPRLTIFVIAISIYECICFCFSGVFATTGTILQWIVFISLILAMYLICISIYNIYRKKKGEVLTAALQKYQKEGGIKNG